jgi:hypothetical protein
MTRSWVIRRRPRRYAVLVDALRLLVRSVSLRPIERRPTMWLAAPPRLVLPRVRDAGERESTTSVDEPACSPQVVVQPTRVDADASAVGQPRRQHRETGGERRRVADALLEPGRWDERDNSIIARAGVEAATWARRPRGDLPTGSTPPTGLASRCSWITETRVNPAAWIAVGLGAPVYSPRDPRLRPELSSAMRLNSGRRDARRPRHGRAAASGRSATTIQSRGQGMSEHSPPSDSGGDAETPRTVDPKYRSFDPPAHPSLRDPRTNPRGVRHIDETAQDQMAVEDRARVQAAQDRRATMITAAKRRLRRLAGRRG